MEQTQKPASAWRRWLKRIAWGLLALFLLLGIFHRPILFHTARYFIARAARAQKLDLQYELGGTIFTSLSVSHLKATPTAPGVVEKLEVGEVNVRYSLVELARKGLAGLLEEIDVRDVTVIVRPSNTPPPQPPEKPSKISIPPLLPKRLDIANVNFISHGAAGDTELSGFNFSLDPEHPGELKIQTLNIPGVRRWSDVSAHATFQDRNLVLTNLQAGPEIQLKRLGLDGSKLEQNEVGLSLDGTLLGATTVLDAHVTHLDAAKQIGLQAHVAGFSFDELWRYLNLSPSLHGTLASMDVSFDGVPDRPAGWEGKVDGKFQGAVFDAHPLGDVTIAVNLHAGRGDVDLLDQISAANKLHVKANGALPEKIGGFAKSAADGQIDLEAPDAAALAENFGATVQGDLTAHIPFQWNGGKLTADPMLNAAHLSTGDIALTQAAITMHVEKEIAKDEPPLKNLLTRIKATLGNVRFKDYAADDVKLELTTQDYQFTLEQLALSKGANSLQLHGNGTVPPDFKSWQTVPEKVTMNLQAPDLQAFIALGSSVNLKGALQVTGNAVAQQGKYSGDFQINARDLQSGDFALRTLEGDLHVADNQARISKMDAVFDDRNHLSISGDVGLGAPFPYHASVDVALTDLSAFQPLLKKAGNDKPLGGSLIVQWQGSGEAQTMKNTGEGTLALTQGRFAGQENLEANLNAKCTPEVIDISTLRVAALQGEATLAAHWENKRLQVHDISIQRLKTPLLSGSIELPLDLAQLKNPDLLLPGDQPLKIALQTGRTDLKAALQQQLGQKQPLMTGTAQVNLSAEGTLNDLVASLAVRGDRLQSTSATNIAPADLALDLNLKGRRLKVNGSVKQALIQPLEITGDVPLDVAAIRQSKTLDPQTPLQLQVHMPSSSLAFVSSLTPQIRFIKGTAAIDVKAGGTIAAPDLSGSIESNLDAVRLTDASLPPISKATLHLDFTRNQVTIQECKGGVAGGTFGASGTVKFAKITEPAFDLKIVTDKALVRQDDNLTARVSCDLKIAGPFNAAAVSGVVNITKSRFFKDIDILPIGLPGRPAPQPPPESPTISFPKPPLRDWKFDVAIKTADPFLIQGNLADGKATTDIHLRGTGLAPYLEGSANISHLTTSLPFSTLEISSGIVYFTQDAPFLPKFNIRGTSTVQNYNITVTIFGTMTKPEAVFSSEPPLPQADIVSLLATGATAKDLSGDPNALAGRAAFLLIQKYYRKIFRKDGPPGPDDNSFLNGAQFDVGAVDPKTGKNSLQVKVPLSKHFALSGGLDVGGDFQGQIKYVIRFR